MPCFIVWSDLLSVVTVFSLPIDGKMADIGADHGDN